MDTWSCRSRAIKRWGLQRNRGAKVGSRRESVRRHNKRFVPPLWRVHSASNIDQWVSLDLHEAYPVAPVTTDKCVDDAETKSLKAAMEGRGMLIKAIVAAVHDPALKAAVDVLMKNAVPMPPTFDELVNMLRLHRASPSHDFRSWSICPSVCPSRDFFFKTTMFWHTRCCRCHNI